MPAASTPLTPRASAFWAALASALVLAACGDATLDGDPAATVHHPTLTQVDAGPHADLELGLGELDFTPITEGQGIDLVQALQGGGGSGAHIWIALRAHGLDPHGVEVKVQARRTSDGAIVSDVSRREDLELRGPDELLVGFRAIVSQCADVAGQALVLTATVTDARALSVTDTRHVTGPADCPRTCDLCDGR